MSDEELISIAVAIAVMISFGLTRRFLQRKRRRVYEWRDWWDEHEQSPAHVYLHSLLEYMMTQNIASIEMTESTFTEQNEKIGIDAKASDVDYLMSVNALKELCSFPLDERAKHTLHASFRINFETGSFNFFPVICRADEKYYVHIR